MGKVMLEVKDLKTKYITRHGEDVYLSLIHILKSILVKTLLII